MSSPEFSEWIESDLRQIRDAALFRSRRTFRPLPGGRCVLDGQTLINLSSNDYLDLAHDQRLISAATAALAEMGVGARASALVSGRTEWHTKLETQLAQFEGTEAAILFPSGYAANLGVVSALASEQDTVFCDRLNHASLIDGCRLSGARLRVFRHDSLGKLKRELEKVTGEGKKIIVTDSVFSMDGSLAPLVSLCDLAEEFQAILMIDEAHATGIWGATGRGLAEELGVAHRVMVRIGTLSKAVGTLGGFVAGSSAMIDWLWNRVRTQIYSTALPPAICAAACQSLEIIQAEQERRCILFERAEFLRNELQQRTNVTIPSSAGPIIPIILQDPDITMNIAAELQEAGFLVGAIRPPTVPEGTSRLRISLTCAHQQDDLERFLKALDRSLARNVESR
ncbi:8-amino-7-oxononanoate synthase [Gimesia fumaroli]|uniref:8-amino-7-ketopelargonate synthase n=1 Tax=Gimesia fumaroli TaxID=2527976 RepID=A0A518IBL5_9PLAN|nr:8-amino-7-oxononanoate synthase [Gimesia fumaroli]QDV50491.1 8-amino-7-oxononanoate synthase 2 [Gimesia fumaroli]